jgi:hypothetical protein
MLTNSSRLSKPRPGAILFSLEKPMARKKSETVEIREQLAQLLTADCVADKVFYAVAQALNNYEVAVAQALNNYEVAEVQHLHSGKSEILLRDFIDGSKPELLVHLTVEEVVHDG